MTGVIILAAGSSSRFGSPKQNLIYKGQTLLQRAINAAIQSICKPVIVILGANAEAIDPTVDSNNVTVIYNNDWQEGMASSIRVGLSHLIKTDAEMSSVVLMLCDQPFVDSRLIDKLVENRLKTGIVACAYDQVAGVPVLFNSNYFPELLSLNGQEGAKKLLLKYKEDVTNLPFPLGSIDIDTIKDFENLEDE